MVASWGQSTGSGAGQRICELVSCLLPEPHSAPSGLTFPTPSWQLSQAQALGKVSGLLQNTLELYLTPGSCPNQKYIGWNLQLSRASLGLEEEGGLVSTAHASSSLSTFY
jgi:hypothetical protein